MSPLTVISRADQEAAKRAEALGRGRYLVTERLALTHDGRVIPEDQCFDGGTLLYIPGMEIPLEEARARGLVKAAEKVEDKAVTRAELEDKAPRRKGK